MDLFILNIVLLHFFDDFFPLLQVMVIAGQLLEDAITDKIKVGHHLPIGDFFS